VSSPMVLSALGGDHTLLQKALTQLGIFAAFAVPGYAVAAVTMDKLGRKTIQGLGFGMMAVTFGLLAVIPNVEKLCGPLSLFMASATSSPSSDPTPPRSFTLPRFSL
jgi:MFS transporter, PHS family, inorganic phosphate transporter